MSTRPVAFVGAVTRINADIVGAMSAGDAGSKYRPAVMPGPMMIVGTCVSYEYADPCVAVIESPRYLNGSGMITTSPLRAG